jgi:uncharacterized protein (DUF305 family)
MTHTTARLGRLAGTLLAGTLVLAGCSGNAHTAAHGSTSPDTSASSSARQSVEHNEADASFAEQMVPHHRSAIAMAQLAPGRAADPRILDLAARIQTAQQPEIDTLTGWLAEWGAGDMSGMDHSSGDGMGGMSEQDMTALANASGADFDRLFLEQMIRHHRAAVEMAVTESAEGQNSDALAMAGSIRDSQNAEIAEMEQLLPALGG